MIRHRGKVRPVAPILRELTGIGIPVHRVCGAAGAGPEEGEEGVVGSHVMISPGLIIPADTNEARPVFLFGCTSRPHSASYQSIQ